MLKGLAFIDDSGVPTDRYFAFLDQGNSRIVLAEAIREAYSDLFAINTSAHELTEVQIKGKFKTLTQGQKSDNVLSLMTKTFIALCSLADFKTKKGNASPVEPDTPEVSVTEAKDDSSPSQLASIHNKLQLHYNIQLILPDARDPKVYDALFSSLKKHILQ